MKDGDVIEKSKAQLMRLATYASVFAAVLLVGIKLATWLYTDSVSVLSSLADSLLDTLASLVNLFAVHHALQPADREHRFGHGKAEPLAGLAQSAFITGSSIFLLFEVGNRGGKGLLRYFNFASGSSDPTTKSSSSTRTPTTATSSGVRSTLSDSSRPTNSSTSPPG